MADIRQTLLFKFIREKNLKGLKILDIGSIGNESSPPRYFYNVVNYYYKKQIQKAAKANIPPERIKFFDEQFFSIDLVISEKFRELFKKFPIECFLFIPANIFKLPAFARKMRFHIISSFFMLRIFAHGHIGVNYPGIQNFLLFDTLLRIINRLLAPDGIFIGNLDTSLAAYIPAHKRFYPSIRTEDIFKAYGFRFIEKTTSGTNTFFVVQKVCEPQKTKIYLAVKDQEKTLQESAQRELAQKRPRAVGVKT